MCSDSWSGSNCLEDLTYVTNKTTFDPRGGGAGGGDPSRLDPNDDGYGGVLTRESWMIPMLALAAVNVIVILTFEVYVVCKAAKNTPSRRHLFLGQMLLLGLLIGKSKKKKKIFFGKKIKLRS